MYKKPGKYSKKKQQGQKCQKTGKNTVKISKKRHKCRKTGIKPFKITKKRHKRQKMGKNGQKY